MPTGYLHDHPNFADLIRILASDMDVDPSLVEKDYWIMHCLYGLQECGLSFKLKGGTSLSKAYGIIHRFSEDIDLQLEPPEGMDVKTGRNQDKPAQRESRREFYEWLAQEGISIDGIISIDRDHEFDDIPGYRSAGIRLKYETQMPTLEGVKDGILLETGFDTISPNQPVTISSWAYDRAIESAVEIIDNRAQAVACYHPGYTFVEKLQAVSTKYRKFCEGAPFPSNFLRHYYDIYCLLENDQVSSFIGSEDYRAHKDARFPKADNQQIDANEAFLLSNAEHRSVLKGAYERTSTLYYQGQPEFDEVMHRIHKNIDLL